VTPQRRWMSVHCRPPKADGHRRLYRDYRFTFQYHEFVSRCEAWALDVRIVHGVPERRGDCPKYRAEFDSVPLLFKYPHRALKKHPYRIEASSMGRWVTR
jgi:hypothetical protein